MGLLNKKDNDAGKVLEKMLDQFDIDLGDTIEIQNTNNSDVARRRQEKKEQKRNR